MTRLPDGWCSRAERWIWMTLMNNSSEIEWNWKFVVRLWNQILFRWFIIEWIWHEFDCFAFGKQFFGCLHRLMDIKYLCILKIHFLNLCICSIQIFYKYLINVESEWVSEYGLTSPSTHYRSFRRQVFPVNHLHWYCMTTYQEQARDRTQNNTKITQHKTGPS